jgi:hypothetical protein
MLGGVPQRFVGSQELTRLFGVKRARVFQVTRTEGFLEPVAVLAMGSIWDLDEVLAWANAVGRRVDLAALSPTPRVCRRPVRADRDAQASPRRIRGCGEAGAKVGSLATAVGSVLVAAGCARMGTGAPPPSGVVDA